MMSFQVHEIIVHHLAKERQAESTIHPDPRLLPIDDVKTRHFAEQVTEVYFATKSRAWGRFHPDDERYPFQRHLREYLDKSGDFMTFAHEKAMKLLKSEIDKQNLATGGFVVFLRCTKERREHFGVLLIKDRRGFVIDEKTLELAETEHLDLDHLNVGCFIDLDHWKQSQVDGADGQRDYLSFIARRDHPALYFVDFIGCPEQRSPREETKRLLQAVRDYLDEEVPANEQRVIEAGVTSYVKDRARAQKPVLRSHVAALVAKEDPGAFEKHASEAYQVGPRIRGDAREADKLSWIEVRRDDLQLQFDLGLLDAETITFDLAEDKLIIRGLGDTLKGQLPRRYVSTG